MVSLHGFAASTSIEWNAPRLLELGCVGFLGVIAILLILTGIIAGISLFFRNPSARSAGASSPAAPSNNTNTMSSPTTSTGISEEHLRVVIAAAVHVALQGEPHTLRLAPANTDWAVDGRRAIFQSRALHSPRVYQTLRR